MAIQWIPNYESTMGMFLHDNTAQPPSTVLDADKPIFVHVYWEVPSAIAAVIGGSFRVRAFAESLGPGQEQQVGATHLEPAVPGKTHYDIHILIPASELRGEGQVFGGVPVSGMYKFVAALQHMNPGPNQVSGYCDGPLVQLKTP